MILAIELDLLRFPIIMIHTRCLTVSFLLSQNTNTTKDLEGQQTRHQESVTHINMADPLAEAMSMLDAVTNGESFEDFAIDSDDDDNLQELDLGNDLLEDTPASDKIEGEDVVAAESGVSTGGSGAEANSEVYDSAGALEHPLQMMGVGGTDPLSRMNSTPGLQNNTMETNQAVHTLSGSGAGTLPNPGGGMNDV